MTHPFSPRANQYYSLYYYSQLTRGRVRSRHTREEDEMSLQHTGHYDEQESEGEMEHRNRTARERYVLEDQCEK